MSSSLILTIVMLIAHGQSANPSADLPDRLNRIVSSTADGWKLVNAPRTDVGRIQRWERQGETLVFQVIECETPEAAETRVQQILSTVSIAPRERFRAGDFAALVVATKRATAYMRIGKRVVIIGAPSVDLAKQLAVKTGRDLQEPPPPRCSRRGGSEVETCDIVPGPAG